jgi:aldehyde:ferredoxin oxidoreductase
MSLIDGNGIRVLTVDLSRRSSSISRRDDLSGYLGGTGLAAMLFFELMRPDLDALHPDQPAVLASGPLNSIFPVVTKVVAVFRSPHTGEYGESHAGMRLGLAMRGAGVDALVITGKASRPTYLVISPEGVKFGNASAIWGLGCMETGAILRRITPGSGRRSCIRIGPAGEAQVTYAGVNVDTYRHFGRLGLGAVFGAKNLKGAVIYGDTHEEIADVKAYRAAYERIYQKVVNTEIMEKYHDLGTSMNVLPLSELNGLPTMNLQKSSFESAEAISGETFAKKTLLRQIACSGCPIGCIHLGLFREEFGTSNEYKYRSVSYDHELIFALGSQLGMDSTHKVYQLIDLVEDLGLDAITSGVAAGWAVEAFQRGLVTEKELETQVAFGETSGIKVLLENIVRQPNEFYRTLARGVEAAAGVYGGLSFALTMAGHEMAGYHTGHANLVGMAMGSRHSHLDNAGYSIDQKLTDQNPEELTAALVDEEMTRNMLTSLCICLFARSVYDTETVVEALSSVGIRRTAEDLKELGRDVYSLKNRIRRELGFRKDSLRFADRFFQTPALVGKLNRKTVEKMLANYPEE